jgi:hypothetical protein
MEQEGKKIIQKELQQFLEEETKEKLLFADDIDWKISVSLTKVKVELSLSQKTVFRPLNCKIIKEMSRIQPVSLLWESERWIK